MSEAKRRRVHEGGAVIVGRPAFKEYMTGLRRGWTESLERVEQDEQLSRELESDGHFDEPEVEDVSYPASSSSSDDFIDGEPIPTPSRLPPSGPPGLFSPLSTTTAIRPPPPPRPTPRWEHPGAAVPPPAQLPQQPPLLLVPFVNLVGIKLIPLMLWEFFHERHKVRAGALAAYKLISRADLDFDAAAEGYYKSST